MNWHLILNLKGNLNINKLNLNNKSLLKLISSNINIKQSSTILPSINISNDKYRQTAYIRYANVENITSSKNTIEARYNLDVQKCVYYYSQSGMPLQSSSL